MPKFLDILLVDYRIWITSEYNTLTVCKPEKTLGFDDDNTVYAPVQFIYKCFLNTY